MNVGAAAARGEILLFLHADTLLVEGFADHVRLILADTSIAAGAFRLRIDADRLAYRLIERGVALRARLLRMPYGDQALFMRRSMFERVGGFPDLPVMEDFEMVRRLKRHGRLRIASAPAITSARRWQRDGILRTTLRNQLAVVSHLLGASPHRLVRMMQRNVPVRLASGLPESGARDAAAVESNHSQNTEPTPHAHLSHR